MVALDDLRFHRSEFGVVSIVRETTVGIALFPTGRVQGDGAGKPSIISRTMLSRACGDEL